MSYTNRHIIHFGNKLYLTELKRIKINDQFFYDRYGYRTYKITLINTKKRSTLGDLELYDNYLISNMELSLNKKIGLFYVIIKELHHIDKSTRLFEIIKALN